MKGKKEQAKQNGFRIRRIRSFITGNTLVNLVLLSILFTCFWAVPAFAEESVETVTDELAVTEPAADPAAQEPAGEPAVEPVQAGADPAPAAEPVVEDSGPVADGGEAVAGDAAVTAAETPGAVPPEDAVAEPAAQDQPLDELPCEECENGQLPLEEPDCDEVLQFLELICGEAFWASMEDYNNGLLSIEYSLTNGSTDTAVNNLVIVSADVINSDKNNVKFDGELPLPLGSLQPGEVMFFVLRWQVPKGVASFVTDISICGDCQELCVDCEPEPECEENCDPPVEETVEPPVPETSPVDDPASPVMSSTLPQTGLDMVKPVIFGLGLAMMCGLAPVARRAYRRIR